MPVNRMHIPPPPPLWIDWIGLSSVLRPRRRQHSIGYIGDGFYRPKDSLDGRLATLTYTIRLVILPIFVELKG